MKRGRHIKKLDRALKVEVNFDKDGNAVSKDFLNAAGFMIDKNVKDKTSHRKKLRELLSGLMGGLVEKDKNKKKEVENQGNRSQVGLQLQ